MEKSQQSQAFMLNMTDHQNSIDLIFFLNSDSYRIHDSRQMIHI